MLLCPLFVCAQGSGIAFQLDLDWRGLQEKAKAERKYIFVDCYTTWCGPCKLMEKEVYINDTVGLFMNDKFLSVKLQMDSTTQDKEEVRRWYPSARNFERLYGIHAYPSYLFFSPDGKIVHKATGWKNPGEFVRLAREALDTAQQYYTLLSHYEEGWTDPLILRSLALEALNLGQDTLGARIAAKYIETYLEKVPEGQLWTKVNINFFVSFTWSNIIDDDGTIFRLFYKDRKWVDSIMGGDGYANFWIMRVIYRQEIYPNIKAALQINTDPDWNKLRALVKRRYSRDEAENDIVIWQANYYKVKKDWKKYLYYLIKSCNRDGDHFLRDSWRMNNTAFEVFKYSNSINQLKKALTWINKSVSMRGTVSNGFLASYLDTQANLLYKLGKKKEALAVEQRSAGLDPSDKVIQENFYKMQNGLPTWIL